MYFNDKGIDDHRCRYVFSLIIDYHRLQFILLIEARDYRNIFVISLFIKIITVCSLFEGIICELLT